MSVKEVHFNICQNYKANMKMIVDIDVEQERREGVRRIFFCNRYIQVLK
jgi:hypothetical protein